MSITFGPIPNFDLLSPGEAGNVLYNQLIPACESKGIRLSQYGNHASRRTLRSIEDYEQKKMAHTLFDIARVQRAFAFVASRCGPTSRFTQGSYGFKHVIERLQGEYLTNGDLIAAMLMNGYIARFAKRGQPPQVNCEFKVKVI